MCAHTPSITSTVTNENIESNSGLVVTPANSDTGLSGFLQITAITGGTLFQADGTTPITNGDFITFAQGETGLTFSPTANSTTTGHFALQASTTANVGGLGGSVVQASVSVRGVPLLTAPATATLNEEQSFSFNGSAISVSDAGNPSGTVSVTLSASHGTLTLSSLAGITFGGSSSNGSSTLSFSGAIAQVNQALNGLSYTPSAHFFGSDTLSAQVQEGPNGVGSDVALTVLRVVHTPTVASASTVPNTITGGIVITPNGLDTGMAGWFKITGITNGTLLQQDGVTPVTDGDFITFAQGIAGLKFQPLANSSAAGSFKRSGIYVGIGRWIGWLDSGQLNSRGPPASPDGVGRRTGLCRRKRAVRRRSRTASF